MSCCHFNAYNLSSSSSQGLWSLISSQCTEEGAEEGGGDGRARSYTYERKDVTLADVAQLSKDFDIVIVASGAGGTYLAFTLLLRCCNARLTSEDICLTLPICCVSGTQKMWSEEDVLPFAYVRGQNVELAMDDERTASGEEEQLESVLLAGEYIVPRRGHVMSGDSVVPKRTLLIGGTHEHCVTMAELEAPPDMEKASGLLMAKMLTMYPALSANGWKPSQCYAGEGVSPLFHSSCLP